MQRKHSAWIYFALWMFQESLNIHYLRGSHIRAAAAGVQQKVHGVLIAPYGRQLHSSQDKARPCKFMHNGTQQPSSRCPWVPCCRCYRCLFTAGRNFDFRQVGDCLCSPLKPRSASTRLTNTHTPISPIPKRIYNIVIFHWSQLEHFVLACPSCASKRILWNYCRWGELFLNWVFTLMSFLCAFPAETY